MLKCIQTEKTILLAEDEALIAASERICLENWGYKVITASSGRAAVEEAEKNPSISLILMDLDLGAGLSGSEAAEIILQKKDLPLIFLSAHTEKEIIEKTEKITSYGYVDKNSGETVLAASIKMALRLFEANLKEKEKDRALSILAEVQNNLIGSCSKKEICITAAEKLRELCGRGIVLISLLDTEKMTLKMQAFSGLNQPSVTY
jgi:CheY-like chemotaxis protein